MLHSAVTTDPDKGSGGPEPKGRPPMNTDHPPQESRRVKRGDRVVILPPDGHGDTWAGSAR